MNFHRKPFLSYYHKNVSGFRRSVRVLCLLLCIMMLSGCAMQPLPEGDADPQDLSSVATGDETDTQSPDTAADTEKEEVNLPVASSGAHYSVREIAAIALDSVVEIRTEQVMTGSIFGQYVRSGAGSGVIIDTEGYIVTNNHVIENASSIVVKLHSGEEYAATLIGTDSTTDIAVIRIEAEGLKAATLGDSSALYVGDAVVAIGNPLGSLGGTVTNGIISALAREISVEGKKMMLLQTNAAINPGNSGGGLFNEAGELIGVVNAKYSEEGIEGLGFAIPVNTAKLVMEDLLTYGYVRGRVHSGASFVDVNSGYSALYYGVSVYGTYVYSVEGGSDAERAGMKSGDILRAIDGTEITSAGGAESILASHAVGDTLELSVTRTTQTGSGLHPQTETEELTLRLTLTEYVPSYVSQGGFSDGAAA